MKRKPRDNLAVKMDAEAADLLAAKDKASLETRLAIFGQVARWVQIRNRIGDAEETAGLLDAYRSTINSAQGKVAEREAERVKRINWEQHGPGYRGSGRPFFGRAAKRAAAHSTRDNGGPQLDELKSRLPGADVGDADGDRRGGGGEISVAIGDSRIVRPELSGNADGLFDEPHSGDEF